MFDRSVSLVYKNKNKPMFCVFPVLIISVSLISIVNFS